MSRKNHKNKPIQTVSQKPPPAASVELVAVPVAPKRAGFSIDDFRSSIKQAESVENPSRIKLLDYYNEILIDLHLTAVVEKRRDSIKATKFSFVDPAGKFNEAIDLLMSAPWWREMLADLLDARFYGYTASWLDLSGGVYHKYKLLPRKHVVPEKGLFLVKQTDREGVKFAEDPHYQNYVVTAGKPDDLGLLLKAIPWVLLKRGDISDWATFNEVFAMPFRKGKYPQYDMVAKKALAEACADAGAMGFAIIPNTTDLEFIQNQASGNAVAYERFATFCDKQLSKGFVHNTMTLDAEGGQYKGDTHEESEKGVYASDRRYILDILNTQILQLLEAHGFNPGSGYFVVESEDHVCVQDRIVVDMQLHQVIEVPAHYWYERYGIPVPEGGPKAKAAAPAPATQLSEAVDRLDRMVAERLREFSESRPMMELPAPPKRRNFFG